MQDELAQAIVEYTEGLTRPAQAGSATVPGRLPGAEVLGSGESQFLSWVKWSQGEVVLRRVWRLGRPELTFACEPRLKQVASTVPEQPA